MKKKVLKRNILLVLLIFAVFFAVYHKGAFTYPYLEDDDPWFHAEVTKYIANYLLIYSKGDSIRKVEGSDILI